MDVIYGIRDSDMNNVHVKEAVLWGLGINETLEPGRFLVDFLPIRMSSRYQAYISSSHSGTILSKVCSCMVSWSFFPTSPCGMANEYVQVSRRTVLRSQIGLSCRFHIILEALDG